jgi:hypothetical protein
MRDLRTELNAATSMIAVHHPDFVKMAIPHLVGVVYPISFRRPGIGAKEYDREMAI